MLFCQGAETRVRTYRARESVRAASATRGSSPMTSKARAAATDATEMAELVLAARRGETRGDSALWRRCTVVAQRIARRWAQSAADADDVSQEALLRAFQSLDSVRDPAALPGWLQVVVVRTVARMSRRRATLGASRTNTDRLASCDPAPDLQVDLQRLLSLLSGLPPQERDCFWLRRAEGLGIREIAEETALSPSTILRRLKGAERRIEKRLRP